MANRNEDLDVTIPSNPAALPTQPIGFIGLGIMGQPMALNLRQAGCPLFVHARRAESMDPLVAAGAIDCACPAEVARQVEILFIMVADTADVEHIILGHEGVLAGARPGLVVVDMSTISAAATRVLARRLAAQGIGMLDAPVSGGEAGAIHGHLSIMVGGDDASFARVLPLFQVLGRKIVHVGGQGAGQICKACNQVVISHTLAGVGEALLFARAAGVDPVNVRAALLGGSAQSKVLEMHGQRMIERNFAPGFKARLHQKDLRLVLETAQEIGLALPGTALAAQYLNALVGRGHGELDSSAIYEVQEAISGREPGTLNGRDT
jgi:2-hydroxy-3-oxopropionate reductase